MSDDRVMRTVYQTKPLNSIFLILGRLYRFPLE
nr:MAG TPA: hypothetical protein [Caudoviricetes sp.]